MVAVTRKIYSDLSLVEPENRVHNLMSTHATLRAIVDSLWGLKSVLIESLPSDMYLPLPTPLEHLQDLMAQVSNHLRGWMSQAMERGEDIVTLMSRKLACQESTFMTSEYYEKYLQHSTWNAERLVNHLFSTTEVSTTLGRIFQCLEVFRNALQGAWEQALQLQSSIV